MLGVQVSFSKVNINGRAIQANPTPNGKMRNALIRKILIYAIGNRSSSFCN